MWYPTLEPNQANRITFVMVDASYTEVAGLSNTFSLFISKNGGLFNPSTATKAEIGLGWYTALLPAGECDTIGPLSIYVTGAGCIQQNLEYVVQQRNAGCLSFTYTLTNLITGLPVPDAEVWVSIDLPGSVIIWNGHTDAFGVARDTDGDLPCLDAGTVYFWATKAGLIANAWPDIEVVS